MFSEVLLAAWSCAGIAWWLIAFWLVRKGESQSTPPPALKARRTLSVFKPLPPLGTTGLQSVAPGLESFVAQLDPDSEMVLGIREDDREQTAAFVDRLRADYPKARLRVVFRSEPDEVANPKIAWQKILAAYATGELWLWSDADIIAPSGFLQSARLEFAGCGMKMMTFPYVVRGVSRPPALLENLFVNVEFYPGVLLLRRMGAVDFGLGAAMLFARDDFLQAVPWNEIGAWLADDFLLGQKLQPVQIGSTTLTSVATSATWKLAFSHDYRWAKTIRWNRPMGAFSRILIMPVLGWLAAVMLYPTHLLAWLGLLGMVQADVLFAMAISCQSGGRLNIRHLPALELWSFWRITLWFSSWLPLRVRWNGRIWRGPRMELKSP